MYRVCCRRLLWLLPQLVHCFERHAFGLFDGVPDGWEGYDQHYKRLAVRVTAGDGMLTEDCVDDVVFPRDRLHCLRRDLRDEDVHGPVSDGDGEGASFAPDAQRLRGVSFEGRR